jgi:hypothetical protein
MFRKDTLDRFYTKPEISAQCVNITKGIVNFDDYDQILEPSVGMGAFFDLLPLSKRKGIDIDPDLERCDILKINFLDYYPEILAQKVLTIGNPPFGMQSKIAVNFFNHTALFSDTIAFIVPITWEKWSVHRRLDQRFKLIHTHRLESNSFIFLNNNYNIRCVFQVWTRRSDIEKENLRILQQPQTTHPDFIFLPKSQKEKADFLLVVCGNRNKLIHDPDSQIAVQTTERIKTNNSIVRKIFEAINWQKYSLDNTGTMWINRETIIKEYIAAKKELEGN